MHFVVAVNLVFCKNLMITLVSSIKILFRYFHSGQSSSCFLSKCSQIDLILYFLSHWLLYVVFLLELLVILDARSVNWTQWDEKGTSLDAQQLSCSLSLSLSLASDFLALLGFSCRELGIKRKGHSQGQMLCHQGFRP